MTTRDAKAAAAAVEDFLRALGRDPRTEPELKDTAQSVARAFCNDLCAGYDIDPVQLLRDETIPAKPSATEVVVLRDLAVTTTCPHHLMPATGLATVAFAPRERLVGIGAIGRALDGYSRRLALQEDIGAQLSSALGEALAPAWAACRLVLHHTCMTARGDRRHGARLETISVFGDCDRATVYRLLGAGP
jgi:GTP cyclohydrolase I